jgi:hypothetical protein
VAWLIAGRIRDALLCSASVFVCQLAGAYQCTQDVGEMVSTDPS